MAEKMMANPGGTIAPEHVRGRDDLIADLWERLETGSLLLTAERRIGKTSVIRKMEAEAPAGKLVYWSDVSAAETPGEFAQSIYEKVEHELSKRNVVITRGRQFLSALSGGEISAVKLPQIADQHWKGLLEKTISDLVEHCGSNVVFLWDEVPWMLDKFRLNAGSPAEGERAAMEVLDILRALRQTYPNLRMVFSGSIGLHHVLTVLRGKGYHNSPVNDMTFVEVPPLELDSACELASELLRNEEIPVDDEAAVAMALASGVGGFSFYIHHLVADLRAFKRKRQTVSASTIENLIVQALEDDADRWQMMHYHQRLSSYYGENAPQVRIVLDEVAAAETSPRFESLLNAVRAQTPLFDAEELRHLIELLRRDHYLTQSGGAYSFRYLLIGRWWRMYRGLAE